MENQKTPSTTPNADYVKSIFGEEAVLLPIRSGFKAPTFPGWQKLTIEDTRTPKFKLIVPPRRDGQVPPRPLYYKVELEKGNIGILQGRPSQGLVSIDIDADEDVEAFVKLNPELENTLQTRGARGRNFWFRVPYDKDTEIKSFDAFRNGVKVYEFRADGRQTVVFGKHPSGKNYEILNLAPIVEVQGFELPEDAVTEEVTSKKELLGGFPLISSIRLERRRNICENVLGEIEWVSATQGLVTTCPNARLHTSPTKHGDTWVFCDGAATLHCFHTSCRQANAAVSDMLRELIGETEMLVLPDGIVTRDQTAEELYSRIASEETIFCRSGVLIVEISKVKNKHCEEELRIFNINKNSAVSRFENYGQFCQKRVTYEVDPKTNVRKKVVSFPPKKLGTSDAEELLNTKAARDLLPPLENIVQCPIILSDKDRNARILSTGYYQDMATYIHYDKELKEVPVAEAVKAIESLGEDYKFVSEGDRMRFFAALLTPALLHGGHIEDYQTPVIVADATKRGSGKTELAKAIAKVYNAVPYSVAKKAGGVGSWDESLNTGLAQGENYLLLDNLRGKLDSQFLESFVTSKEKTPVRVPGQAEVIVDARNTVVFATSNGFQATADLADRALFINIQKQPDGYEFKTGSLITRIQKSQGYYLSCVFSILEEWIKRGSPKTDTTEHRMRYWARSVESILHEFFGYEQSLFEGHKETQSVASNSKLMYVLNLANLLEKENKLGKYLRAIQLGEIGSSEGVFPPGLPYNARSNPQDVAKTLATSFKSLFEEHGDERKIGSFTFHRKTEKIEGRDATFYAVTMGGNLDNTTCDDIDIDNYDDTNIISEENSDDNIPF
jgi:hypothetical protein